LDGINGITEFTKLTEFFLTGKHEGRKTGGKAGEIFDRINKINGIGEGPA
jgi:hypothetical protein